MVSIEEGLIKDKIKSYIYQDCETLGMNAECKEKGNKSLPKNYIEVNDVKILIEVQDNKCYICKEPSPICIIWEGFTTCTSWPSVRNFSANQSNSGR